MFSMDSDTSVAPDIVDRLVEAMDTDPSLGIVGPTMYFHSDPDVVWWAGGDTDPDSGFSRHWRYGERDDGGPEEVVVPCTFITGAGMFIRREVLERIGPFDESYFHTSEDNDLCVRTQRVGFTLGYAPRARMWHKIMSTTGGTARTNPIYAYYEYRNRFLFVRKHSRNGGWMRKLDTIARKTLRTGALLIVREKNPAALYAMMRGMFDFARGRKGRVDYTWPG